MTDTTRPDEVEAIMELAESYCEKRHTLGAPEYNVVTARARDTLRAAAIAALTAPASKPAEVERNHKLYGGIIRAAVNLLAACQERHDTQPAPQCYGVPYGAVNALRDALEGHAKPAEGGVVDERAAFEAWAERTGRHLHKVTPCDGSKPQYLDACALMAWEAWQARAALAREGEAA